MKIRRRCKPVLVSQAALCAAFLFHCALAAAATADWFVMPASLLPGRLPVDDSPSWVLGATAKIFEAADAVPVRAISGDWDRYTPRATGNVALQSAGIEFSAERQGWEVATTLRSEVLIAGSRGTFDAVHSYKQKQVPTDGTEFPIETSDMGAVWVGLRGAHSWVLRPGSEHGLTLTGAATLLSVRKVQVVEASGQVRYSSNEGYGFDAQTLRQDSRQNFGGVGRKNAIGNGVSLDIGLLWQLSPATFVNLSAVDLYSKLRVDEVSTQRASLSSSTNSLDASGYLVYQPLVSGRNSATDLTLELHRKWSASVGTRVGWRGVDGLVGVRWERLANIDMPAVWAVVPVANGLSLQLDCETRFRSIGVGLTGRSGGLMLRTRSLTVGQSNALGWHATLNLPL